jgi:hypothetical protein
MALRIFVAAVLAALLIGPAQAMQPDAADRPAADANVYIVRENAEPTLWGSSVRIDGLAVASLGQRSYTAVRVAPGTHGFRLSWPIIAGQSGDEFDLEIEAGQTYYLAVLGVSRVTGGGYHVIYYRLGSSMARLKSDEGQRLVASCCRYRRPRVPGLIPAPPPRPPAPPKE